MDELDCAVEPASVERVDGLADDREPDLRRGPGDVPMARIVARAGSAN
jgi:hypothetical protein